MGIRDKLVDLIRSLEVDRAIAETNALRCENCKHWIKPDWHVKGLCETTVPGADGQSERLAVIEANDNGSLWTDPSFFCALFEAAR